MKSMESPELKRLAVVLYERKQQAQLFADSDETCAMLDRYLDERQSPENRYCTLVDGGKPHHAATLGYAYLHTGLVTREMSESLLEQYYAVSMWQLARALVEEDGECFGGCCGLNLDAQGVCIQTLRPCERARLLEIERVYGQINRPRKPVFNFKLWKGRHIDGKE